YSGVIQEIHAQEGETIEVGQLMCYIEVEEIENSQPTEEKVKVSNENNHSKSSNSKMKTRYSPVVMRLAQEHDINLNDITGTGKGGRITRKDMDSWIKNPQKSNTSQ